MRRNTIIHFMACFLIWTGIATGLRAQCSVTLTQQPVLPALVCEGPGSQTIAVTAAGAADVAFTYQWYFNDAAIGTNGTSASYTISSLQGGSNGQYKVRVTGTCNNGASQQVVVSNPVDLNLGKVPVLTSVFTDQTLCAGSNFSTTATANTQNGGPLSYSWKFVNTNTVVSSAALLSLNAVSKNDSGQYSITPSNSCGTGKSSSFILGIKDKPVSTALNNTTTLNACVGQTLTLSTQTNSNNGGTPGYAWYKVVSGTPIALPASNTDKYNFASIQAADAGIYRLISTNTCGNAISPVDFTVNTPQSKPRISTQPQAANVNCSDYTLSMNVTGSSDAGAISYAWTYGGGALPSVAQTSTSNGGNTGTLVLTNPTPSHNGFYKVTLTNNCGSTESVAVNVNVDVVVPAFTTNPAAHLTCENQPLTEAPVIQYQGNFNFSYAWYKSGSGVVVGTSRTITLPAFTDANAGDYKLRVTNTCGTFTESPLVTFSIAKTPLITTQPLVTGKSCIGQNATISVAAGAQNGGTMSYTWYKDNTVLNGQNNASVALSNLKSNDQGNYRVDITNSCGTTQSNSLSLSLGSIPTLASKTADNTYCYGSDVLLNVTANSNGGGALAYQWSSSASGAIINTNSFYTITNLTAGKTGTYDIQISNDCGVAATPASIAVNGTDKPQITQFTSNATTFCAGSSLNLNVTATSSASITYAWYRTGTLLPTSTTNYYQAGNIQPADAGSYTVKVSNACGSTTSAAIAITINNKPSITTDITKSIDCSGSKSLSLTVTGSDNGGGLISYQWYKNSLAIGGNTSSLVFTGITESTSGSYYVVLTNGCGSARSASANVNIDFSVPLIQSQPTSATVCTGQSLIMQVSVKDGATRDLTYQWMKGGVNLAGQNLSTLSKDVVGISDAGFYTVQVTGICGAAITSDQATLTVKASPTPAFAVTSNTTQCISGNNFSFSDISTTSGSFIREWVFDDGTTSTQGPIVQHTYNTAGVHNVALRHTAANGCFSAISQNITVSTLPSVTQQLKSKIGCINGDLSLDVIANDNFGGNISYLWKKNGVGISGANSTSGSLLFTGLGYPDQGRYNVEIRNSCGVIYSDTVTISISEKPGFLSRINSKRICEGSVDTLFVNTSSVLTPSQYNWYIDTVFLAKTTTPYLSFADFRQLNAGTYHVDVQNACGLSTSNNFSLSLNKLPVAGFIEKTDTSCYNSSKLILGTFSTNPNDTLIYRWYLNDQLLASELSDRIRPLLNNTYVYQFKVQATNGCGSVTKNVNTTYVNRIASQFVVDSTGGCRANLSVNIQNKTLKGFYPLTTWKALYDDGFEEVFPAATATASHSYRNTGAYTLTLIAYDSAGCIADTLRYPLRSYGSAKASFAINDTCVGAKALFRNLSQPGATSNGFNFVVWKTNDQQIADTASSLLYQYTRSGIYPVTLYVQGKNSCLTDSITKNITIIGAPSFVIDTTDGCRKNLTVTVQNESAKNGFSIRNYLWNIDYGDGTVKNNLDSASLKDTHIYSRTGIYTVTLNATGAVGCQSRSLTQTVYNYGITKADFAVKDTCVGSIAIFENKATKGFGSPAFDFVRWKIEDQLIEDSTISPTYLFAKPGTYRVTQYVQGIRNCIVDSVSRDIRIADIPRFSIDTMGACAGKLNVTVTNKSSAASIRNFLWNVNYGDGYTNPGLDSAIRTDTHNYTRPGSFPVTVTIAGQLGCQSQVASRNVRNIAVTKADFAATDTCLNTPSIFINNSVKGFGNDTYGFVNWLVNGRIITDTAQVVKYIYPATGLYRVTLTVQGNNSCAVDSMSKIISIVGKPAANFIHIDSCAGFDVLLKDISRPADRDQIQQWQWNYGDGSAASFSQNPVHVFKQPGSYFVNLLVQSASCPQFFADTSINITVIRPRPNLRYNTIYAMKNTDNQLSAYPNGRSYEWTPRNNLNNTRIQQPIVNPDFSAFDYSIKITDSAGCINVDSVKVWGFTQPEIYLPTAFSPNNDGYNDYYKGEYVLLQRLEFFRILDMPGNVLFETSSMTEKWDGRFKGRNVPTGTYQAIVSGIDRNGQRLLRKTTFVLLR